MQTFTDSGCQTPIIFTVLLTRSPQCFTVFWPVFTMIRMSAALPPSQTGLFRDTSGNIRCVIHALEIEESRWQAEGWAPIAESEQAKARRYQCQKCRPNDIPA